MRLHSSTGWAQSRLLAVLAIVTLGLLGYFVFTGLNASLQERKWNHGEALRVAEYVLQQELERMHANQNWRNEDRSGTEPAVFSIHKQVLDSLRIEILARAEIADISREIRCVVARSHTADSALSILSWEEE